MSKVILITGASAGIGRSCAVALSKAFAPLVLVLSGRRQDELEVTARACREGTTTTVQVVPGDVSKDADVESMFKMVKEKYGRLDVLFNNAGCNLLRQTPLEDSDMDTFRTVLDVNVMGSVLCTREAIKIMKAQSPQGGRIINNGSISATSPRPDSASYTVSKHAIRGLTRSTSLDGRKYHITATQIDIGNAQTAMGGRHSSGSLQADGSIRPEPTMDVENVAKTVCFIAGLDNSVDVLSLEILAAGMPYIGRG